MLKFSDIQLSDKKWIDEILSISNFMACEYCFANNIAWRRLGDTKICHYKNFYISCALKDNNPIFTFPAGEGNYRELIHEMKFFSKEYNVPLQICSVSNEKLNLFSELFPNEFTIEKNEDSFDYIYYTNDLAALSGKKYHQKRNHLSKFYSNNNWTFEPITSQNQDECIEMSVISYNNKQSYDDESSVAEQFAINTYFNNFEYLNLKGGVLRVDGKLVAFTIGEKINSDTFCIHIEKALHTVQGAYAAINNEFIKSNAMDCLYINREEDLGLEGLRKSKRSYYPCVLLEKSTITFNN